MRSRGAEHLEDRLGAVRALLMERPVSGPGDEEAAERRQRPWLALVIAVVVGVLATFLAGQTAARMWLEDLDARLLDAGAGANAHAVMVENEHLEAYRAIAYSEGFAADLQRYDVDAITERILPVDANHGIPMIDIIDDQNRVVFAFRAEGAIRPVYRERRSIEIVRKALAGERDEYGERFSSIIATDEGPLIATSGPVRDGDRVVGALLIMTPVDELLSQARNLHGAHVTAYSVDRGDPLATTTPIRPRTLDTPLRTTLAQPEELPYATRLEVAGSPYREQIGNLTIRHRMGAFLGSALPDRSRQVAQNVMLIVAIGMALMSVLVATVVRAWTKDGPRQPPAVRQPAALPPPPPQPDRATGGWQHTP